MGRFDPIYDDETRQRIIELINQDKLGPTPAVQKLEAETGIRMPKETARVFAREARKKAVPKLQKANPISPMVDSLLSLANAELHAIRCNEKPGTADLDRASKVAKLLLDVDKLRKANETPTKEDKDTSPLAVLTGPASSKPTTKRTAEHDNSGSSAPVRNGSYTTA